MRKRIFDIIQIGNKEDLPSRAFDIFIVINIVANITVMFMETFDELAWMYSGLRAVEIITLIFFCVEYALRIWTADYLYPERTRGQAILRFLVSYDGIVDLLTILPFFFLSGFVVFRMLRVVRIFHLFRINATYDSFNVITTVLWEKRNQLASSIFIIMVLMFGSSLCMYSVEHEAQPEVFRNAFSGIWWSMSTLLTVGYGDIYPITVVGRIMAIIIAFLGVGVVAVPTGIISSGFVQQYYQARSAEDISGRNTVTMKVDRECNLTGMTVGAARAKHHLTVVAMIRGSEALIPTDSTIIKTGDTIVFLSQKKLSDII